MLHYCYKFFPIIFFWLKLYSFPIMLIYKTFNFCYFFRTFSYFFMSYCNYYSILRALVIIFIGRTYLCFCVFYPIRSICIWSRTIRIIYRYCYVHSLYYKCHKINYDIYNTMNEHNKKQTHYVSLIPIIFESFFCFHNFICFIINHDFYGITFWIYYMIFITITFKRNKINLRSFMISFKYGLILLRTS